MARFACRQHCDLASIRHAIAPDRSQVAAVSGRQSQPCLDDNDCALARSKILPPASFVLTPLRQWICGIKTAVLGLTTVVAPRHRCASGGPGTASRTCEGRTPIAGTPAASCWPRLRSCIAPVHPNQVPPGKRPRHGDKTCRVPSRSGRWDRYTSPAHSPHRRASITIGR